MSREPTLISSALTASTMAAGVDSDDDWETADLDNFAKPGLAAPLPLAATQPSMGSGVKILSRPGSSPPPVADGASLRPSAPAFQPKPKPSGAKVAWRGAGGSGPGAELDEWYRDPISRGPNTNRTIWDTANKAAPPVTLISSNDTSGAPLPPPPSIKILRRPSPSQPTPSRSASASSEDRKKTLEQRELDYQRARERIFASNGGASGSEPNSTPTSQRPSPTSSPKPTPAAARQSQGVLRQPRGPDSRTGSGFGQGPSQPR